MVKYTQDEQGNRKVILSEEEMLELQNTDHGTENAIGCGCLTIIIVGVLIIVAFWVFEIYINSCQGISDPDRCLSIMKYEIKKQGREILFDKK